MEKHVLNVSKYILVFGALLILTLVTVGVSKLHLGVVGAIVVALLVASLKGSLVLSYFMHLIGENKWIYLVLIITVFLFLFMLLVPLIVSSSDYRM